MTTTAMVNPSDLEHLVREICESIDGISRISVDTKLLKKEQVTEARVYLVFNNPSKIPIGTLTIYASKSKVFVFTNPELYSMMGMRRTAANHIDADAFYDSDDETLKIIAKECEAIDSLTTKAGLSDWRVGVTSLMRLALSHVT
jgi:hypothetical protein